MSPCCREDINPAGLHRRPRPVCMQTGAIGIAFLAPPTWATAHTPCLVIVVEKESNLKIDYEIIDLIYNLVPFLPMAVDQDGMGVGVQGPPHRFRGWGGRRAAEASAITKASELALKPYPGGGDDARGLDHLRMISTPLQGHRDVRAEFFLGITHRTMV